MKQKNGPAAVFQGMYVLWAMGMCVGLGIAGEWRVLAVFSGVTVGAHGFAVLVSEWLTRRDVRRKEK